jgi:hypothetical protein
VDDEVGHVADEVGSEPEVEEHVGGAEQHLPGVLGVQIAVPRGGHRRDGPVQGGHVAGPQLGVLEVWHDGADPGPPRVRVPVGDQIVDAAGTVDGEKGDLACRRLLGASTDQWSVIGHRGRTSSRTEMSFEQRITA